MTRLYNDPAAFAGDAVDGFAAAYERYVRRVPGTSGVMRAAGPRPGKVGVIVGGGSGHYPAFYGLVGPGLADGAVIGDIFTSPSASQAYQVATALDGGAGVLFSYGNYAGDVMNFGQAQARLRAEGVDCRTVLVTDDMASASVGAEADRRGIAGGFCVFKLAGAAAERGEPIDEVERIAAKTNARTRTLGAAFAGCTFPGAAEPLFTVAPSKMELGLGIHGEPGVRTVDRLTAAELAQTLTEAVLGERPADADGRVAVLLNGLGSTKYEELFVIWKDVAPRLRDAGLIVLEPEVGELVTSLDMAGCSLTLCWLDDELEELWLAPADTPAFRRGDASLLGASAEAPAIDVEPARAAATEPTSDRAAAVGVASSAAPAPRAGAAMTNSGQHDAAPESIRAAATVRTALEAMRDTVADNEQRLGELDAVAGDGDHGRGMLRGLRAACEAVGTAADTAVDAEIAPHGAVITSLGAGAVLRTAGAAWADGGAGSSGVLWGAFLRAVGEALGDREPPSADAVVHAFRAGRAAVTQLGGAAPGDKTLVDALDPFVAVLAVAVDDGEALAAAWGRAAEAATAAAEATRDLKPRKGRARPLADKSLGTPDPGAVSLALCAEAVGRALSDTPCAQPLGRVPDDAKDGEP